MIAITSSGNLIHKPSRTLGEAGARLKYVLLRDIVEVTLELDPAGWAHAERVAMFRDYWCIRCGESRHKTQRC